MPSILGLTVGIVMTATFVITLDIIARLAFN